MNVNLANAKTLAIKGFMQVRKISPELVLGAGIVCGVGAIVVGVLSAKKVNEVVEETQAELDEIQDLREHATEENPAPLDADIKKMTWKAYNKLVWKIAKALAPAIGLEVASIALILLSHGVLKKRYLNTTAAYAALSEAYRGYRGRVKEAMGEDAEKILAAGGKIEKGIQVEKDDDTVEKKTGNSLVIQEHKNSPYEFDFNRHTSTQWSTDPDYSDIFLRHTQDYFNDLLQVRGHVFMNEVLDALGMKRTPAGAICGWIKGAGDDYIDFGYLDTFTRDYKVDSDLCRKNIHLDFNVDGQIWDMI